MCSPVFGLLLSCAGISRPSLDIHVLVLPGLAMGVVCWCFCMITHLPLHTIVAQDIRHKPVFAIIAQCGLAHSDITDLSCPNGMDKRTPGMVLHGGRLSSFLDKAIEVICRQVGSTDREAFNKVFLG